MVDAPIVAPPEGQRSHVLGDRRACLPAERE
jgi:hypothetical protein